MISIGIEKFDHFFGRIKDGLIIDIFGGSGTGKSLLSLQIILNSLNNDNKQVLFLDTTGKFRPERMLEMINKRNLNTNLLDNIKVARITNTVEQIKYLEKIRELENISLIVIDNVTELFSFEYAKNEKLLEKNKLFMKYMHDLSFIAIQKKIPIIITNSIININDTEKENLEKAIDPYTHVKIKLNKSNSKFFGTIKFLNQKLRFSYLISSGGMINSS
jgi:DNA repair protein RAD51